MPRIPDSIQNPGQILARAPGTLHQVLGHARQLLALQQEVRRLVPGDVYVAACDDHCLHLITPSSALATRIKYNQRRLLASLGHLGRDVNRIRISVRPDYIKSRKPEPRDSAQISPENARNMASAAKYIEDEGLRKALLSLSNRASGAKTHQ